VTHSIEFELDDTHTTACICFEIGTLLGVPETDMMLDPENAFEDELVHVIVEALVKYGKERSQIMKISQISRLLCGAIGLGKTYCDVLGKASLIYDIGNLGIDPVLYKKDNRLSFEEFEIIKYHTIIGRDALLAQKNATLDMAALIAAQHHEWYDGGGYPHSLKGKEIAISARIVSLADTVVALFSPRHGREIMAFNRIVEYIKEGTGHHFDPEVVERFLEYKEEVENILTEEVL